MSCEALFSNQVDCEKQSSCSWINTGGQVKTRTVECQNKDNGQIVDDNYCPSQNNPNSSIACYDQIACTSGESRDIDADCGQVATCLGAQGQNVFRCQYRLTFYENYDD